MKKTAYDRIIVEILLADGFVIKRNWNKASERHLITDAANSIGVEETYIKRVEILERY